MLGLLDAALLQGLFYGVGAIGVAIAFRVLRYPDLTADGAFVLAAACFAAAMLTWGWPWWAALLAALAAGGMAGITTGLIHQVAGVNRLLSGILTTMVCYSLAFRVLSNRGNRSIHGAETPLSWAAAVDRGGALGVDGLHAATLLVGGGAVAGVVLILGLLFRSEWGLVLRATGSNRSLVQRFGLNAPRFTLAGLFLANALVGVSASMVVARDGFVDVNMGVGIIIVLIAALVVGEQILHWVAPKAAAHAVWGPILAALVGTFLYYMLYLVVLRASVRGWLPFGIQPTDLRMLSAVLVILMVLVRSRSARPEPEHSVVL